MVFTLHRYIFRETFRVFVLAVVALTLMLSLGSVLRPVQEYGVGPNQVIHLIGYFLPITLTFVLPMAALFATSLVYGRFASDNELDACRASGISLLTLVYPGLALAIMVATANLLLSFYVVPAFVLRAEKSIKDDAKQIFFRNLQRKGYYSLPPDERYRIYADLADSEDEMLSGVVIAEVKEYEIKKIITAENAKVHFIPYDRFNEVRITAYNTYQIGSESEEGFSAAKLAVTARFSSLLGDNIKFKKIDEMKKIHLDIMRFYPIEKLARETYAQFTAELLAQDIAGKANADANSFYKLMGEPNSVKFTAGSCSAKNDKTVELSGEVAAFEYDTDTEKPLRTVNSQKASLYIEGDELAPTLTMELYNAMWQRPDGSQGLDRRPVIRGLILPKSVTYKFIKDDVLRTVSPAWTTAALQKKPSQELKTLQNKLWRKIRSTQAEIQAEIHSRLVFGIGCLPLIMIGIGLGIMLKGGHLLTAFGVSSVPAAVLIVCIMMGRNITKNPSTQLGLGIALMWASLVFLSLLAAVIYRKLLKH